MGWISCISVCFMFISVGSRAVYSVFQFCLFFSKLFCFFQFLCLFLLFMFSPSLFKFLHLQSNKNTYTNRSTNIKSLFPSRNLRDNYSRRFVGWIFCISVLFVFLEAFLFLLLFLSVVFYVFA